MERVVYILGAGFSAPAGLPVVSDFIIKSRDLYYSDPNRYNHFNDVFELINEMASAKNYYNCDLFDIEEVLSILEMNNQLHGHKIQESFISYICDVIEHFTPEVQKITRPGNWYHHAFGTTFPYSTYGPFVASLFHANLQEIEESMDRTRRFIKEMREDPHTQYDVISLNYDCLLERVLEILYLEYDGNESLEFNKEKSRNTKPHLPGLFKLHGCVSSREIIPPTWSKSVAKNIQLQWKLASDALGRANHIRILGYSLPISDSYIKYLLKGAALRSEHLKSIDIITLDSDGRTFERYQDFIGFKFCRMRNAGLGGYFDIVKKHANLVNFKDNKKRVEFYNLEKAHYEFMDITK
jgi:hypothetical protein